jgi:hypothetical protein
MAARRSDLHPLGVWERLLKVVQQRGIQLGMTFLDGTSVRAHQKAARARRKEALKLNETVVRGLAENVHQRREVFTKVSRATGQVVLQYLCITDAEA